MSAERQHVKLGFSIWATGIHPAGWRLSGANAHGTFDPHFIRQTAQTAERGLLDFYFIGDRVVGLPSSQYEAPNEVLRPEALTLAGFIAGVTEQIGIVTTVNTTYAEPYTTARATAELDHLSGGRLAVNLVTGKNEEAAGNFGRDHHWAAERRYSWAGEFVEVLKGLWDSWEDGALVGDKSTGLFVDESRVHRTDHRGEHFSVAGPLNITRPPQGHVPLLHAGTSEESHDFGAQHADIRFIPLREGQAATDYYAELQRRRASAGYESGQQAVAGLSIFVAETASEARSAFREAQSLVLVPADLQPVADLLGVDLTEHHSDTPLNEIPRPALDENSLAVLHRIQTDYDDESPTLREIALHLKKTQGHAAVIGDARHVADYIEERFQERHADGFILFPPYLPGPLESFVDLVVPELQRRGLFKTAREKPQTFREVFGLGDRPHNRHLLPTESAGAEATV